MTQGHDGLQGGGFLIKTHNEKISSNFKGTIIDIETIGCFDDRFGDSRRYARIKPVIFGFMDGKSLSMRCAGNEADIGQLKKSISLLLGRLQRPFAAFNCDFEMGVLSHNLNRRILFDAELNAERYEKKKSAVCFLGIRQYGDPFDDDGKACMEAWKRGEVERAKTHNRSCLLKERDILLKRGSRKPDGLEFVPAF